VLCHRESLVFSISHDYVRQVSFHLPNSPVANCSPAAAASHVPFVAKEKEKFTYWSFSAALMLLRENTRTRSRNDFSFFSLVLVLALLALLALRDPRVISSI
jgi:hypothetical protein